MKDVVLESWGIHVIEDGNERVWRLAARFLAQQPSFECEALDTEACRLIARSEDDMQEVSRELIRRGLALVYERALRDCEEELGSSPDCLAV